MSIQIEYGVMHRDGHVIPPDGSYPFKSSRMADALARDLDEYCGEDCGNGRTGKHQVVQRTISEWHVAPTR